MRIGEASSLQKKDILQTKDGEWFARVSGTLLTHRNEPEKNKRHSKSNSAKTGNSNHLKGKKLNDFLFVNEWPTSDGYFIPGKVNNVLKSIARRQGIKKDLTSHFFRHTHISKLAELGVPLYVIQKRVGHGNSRITREIYLHVTDKVKKDLKNKLDMLDVSSDPPSLKVLKN